MQSGRQCHEIALARSARPPFRRSFSDAQAIAAGTDMQEYEEPVIGKGEETS